MTTQTTSLPGPKSQQVLDELQKYIIVDPHPYAVDLAASKGMYMATVDGDMLFDWGGYYGAKLLSHNHPGLFEEDYLKELTMVANHKIANPDFLTPQCLAYYRLMRGMAPKCMENPNLELYVVNSGAEAVENMLKYLINMHDAKRKAQGRTPGIRRFVYFDCAFHGRTVFALNITQLRHDPVMTKGFKGMVPANIEIPFPAIDNSQPEEENIQKTEQALNFLEAQLKLFGDEIVGIIFEPIQGAGGHRIALPDFYRKLSELAHKYDTYLGVDEVQTAGGQTGSMFCMDHFDLPYPPQAIAVAKKFGNGVLYMKESMTDEGVLDSTWGGSLVDMVRFSQEMKIIEREGLVEQVPEKEKHFVALLNDLCDKYPDIIYNVRGMGVYQGISFHNVADKGKFVGRMLHEQQTILIGAGTDTIRFRPPIDVTIEDMDLLHEKFEAVLSTF
ncbi:putative L-lysine-epsilon aminotransferase [Poriferisphaera corsica]|uniref:Putative L-lysine-epsilon aminotransferase n=1 Tax=Poriferisphaera corsica TaxID=2528020 RepID=A0A517YQS3_9BACT|nr:aminotransferase class III-fold pyridoxal phosphate-dependent enzyme [Poriferisphaera corsica]QDU32564.1 putative L-lysine-epsilon aminotransferase [Poriferisphaera corsica]